MIPTVSATGTPEAAQDLHPLSAFSQEDPISLPQRIGPGGVPGRELDGQNSANYRPSRCFGAVGLVLGGGLAAGAGPASVFGQWLGQTVHRCRQRPGARLAARPGRPVAAPGGGNRSRVPGRPRFPRTRRVPDRDAVYPRPARVLASRVPSPQPRKPR